MEETLNIERMKVIKHFLSCLVDFRKRGGGLGQRTLHSKPSEGQNIDIFGNEEWSGNSPDA